MKKTKKVKLIPFGNILKEQMKDPRFKKAYEDLQPEFTIIKALIIARARHGFTQRELAKHIGIPQSSLARFESGRTNPTLSFLQKITHGLGLKLSVK